MKKSRLYQQAVGSTLAKSSRPITSLSNPFRLLYSSQSLEGAKTSVVLPKNLEFTLSVFKPELRAVYKNGKLVLEAPEKTVSPYFRVPKTTMMKPKEIPIEQVMKQPEMIPVQIEKRTPKISKLKTEIPQKSRKIINVGKEAYSLLRRGVSAIPRPQISIQYPTVPRRPKTVTVTQPVSVPQVQYQPVHEREVIRERPMRIVERPIVQRKTFFPRLNLLYNPELEFVESIKQIKKNKRKLRLRYAPQTYETDSLTFSPTEITQSVYSPVRYRFARQRYAPETFVREDVSPYTYAFLRRVFAPYSKEVFAPQYYNTQYQTYEPVNVDKYRQKTSYTIADNTDISPPYILQNIYDPKVFFSGNKFAPEINNSAEVDISPKTTMVFNLKRPKPSETNVYLNVLNNLLKKKEVRVGV